MKTNIVIPGLIIALCVIFLGSQALAVDEYNTSTGTTVDGQGVALRGNDSVALFTNLEVTPGFAEFSVVQDNVAYYFSSAKSMKQFMADPTTYITQFGGYCAFGVAKGKKLDGSPRFADVLDGKIYLFLNAAVFKAYKKDRHGIINAAKAKWPGIEHRSVEDVNGL